MKLKQCILYFFCILLFVSVLVVAEKNYSPEQLAKLKTEHYDRAHKFAKGIDTVFPNITSDTSIISKLIQLLKDIVGGNAAMVQVDQIFDSVPLTDMYHYQEKSSVVSLLVPPAQVPGNNITLDFCNGERTNQSQIIELDPSYVEKAPIFVKQFLIPQMNKLALKIEKKNDYNCKFHSIKIVPIPDEVLQQEFNQYLVAIVDARRIHIEKYSLVFYVHPSFLNVWNTDDTFDQRLLEYLFTKADKILPKKLTIASFLELFKEMPKIVMEACQKFGMSKACAACLVLLCLVVPFFWNYFFFEMATVVCGLLKLPAQTCIGIQLTSFMLAYIMIYPSSVAIFRFCKQKVCTSGLVNFLFKDAPIISYSWTVTYLRSLFQ